MALNPYLNFAGNTAEAMAHYRDLFGGELTVFTFGDYDMPEMPADGVMHASLVADDLVLMASDAMPGAEESWGGTRVYLSFTSPDAERVHSIFGQLAAGGSIGMPLEKQVWGDEFGLVKDRYGIEWMFTVATPD
ncbi:VOC family protein [Aestuariimicrobium ganziense]|uniref:VOC family protein n=1 Tax=Aestuariimicrobium ganziense TaxID=2773677 RepID=UPI001940A49B|nr:VOC family protein [Aestuariimicrobium ganziense]